MRETRLIMGMPITVEVVGVSTIAPIEEVFAYFTAIDARFSTYKPDSEISAINRGEIRPETFSPEMREIFILADATKQETQGYFDIRRPDGQLDPSGLVKGWAIRNAANLLLASGLFDFCVEAGGDIQCAGHNEAGEPWRVGIRNPFDARETVQLLRLGNAGIATSGNYVRGEHIYDPHRASHSLGEIVSLTVVAADIYDADRFATAAFAMGPLGIQFVESTSGLEGYAIAADGIATMTRGFKSFTRP